MKSVKELEENVLNEYFARDGQFGVLTDAQCSWDSLEGHQ